MRPADQRLATGDPAVPEVDDRLVVQHQLIAVHGVTQVDLQTGAPGPYRLHARLEDLDAARAVLLGGGEGEVRALQQGVRVALAERAERDAGGGVDRPLAAADPVRVAQ